MQIAGSVFAFTFILVTAIAPSLFTTATATEVKLKSKTDSKGILLFINQIVYYNTPFNVYRCN